MITRRQFNKGLIYTALSGLAFNVSGQGSGTNPKHLGFGALVNDPNDILSLPPGFSYRIISKLNDQMDDGLPVPDRADGMGCIPIDDQRVALIRNHEIHPRNAKGAEATWTDAQTAKAYDVNSDGKPLQGGTSSIIYNVKTKRVEQQFMSLLGTIRNCSGGITPWGTWLTCEESIDTPTTESIGKEHGYVFEIPAKANGLVEPKPLKDMGRFNHEAACVDPKTGYVYLTEDRGDSLFYRFIPNKPQELSAGGKLQALAIKGSPQFDSRNWQAQSMSKHKEYDIEWIDLEDVTSPNDDLRVQGLKKGAALFARGEGTIFGDNELYFCCTNGGKKQLGQIMRYSLKNPASPTLSLFLESENAANFNFGDNLCIGPNGHLVVCEDQYTDVVNNALKGVTPSGETYNLARIHVQTEPAGACFSPDGTTMFVNLYSPAMTLAITGPWDSVVG